MATRNIVPRATGEGNIGTSLKHWLKGWFDSLFVSGNLTDGSNDVTVLQSKTAYTHSQLTSGNPHSVTKTDVGLSAVTNDAQLKRADGDLNSFTEKTAITGNDIIIIEDSAASYQKKKAKLSNCGNAVPSLPGDFQSAQSNGESSTTSATYQDKVTMTFTAAFTGTYILGWQADEINSNANKLDFIRILQDATTLSEVQNANSQTYNAGTNFAHQSGWSLISLTATTSYTFKLQWLAGANTAYIRNAKLMAWRVT